MAKQLSWWYSRHTTAPYSTRLGLPRSSGKSSSHFYSLDMGAASDLKNLQNLGFALSGENHPQTHSGDKTTLTKKAPEKSPLPLSTEARRAATLWWKESFMSTSMKGMFRACSWLAAAIPPKPPPTITTRTAPTSTDTWDPIANQALRGQEERPHQSQGAQALGRKGGLTAREASNAKT